jgi:hypothetical protein
MEEEDRAREKYLKSKPAGSETTSSGLSDSESKEHIDVSLADKKSANNDDYDYDDEF